MKFPAATATFPPVQSPARLAIRTLLMATALLPCSVLADATLPAYEYYVAATDQYFYTVSRADVELLDGLPDAGWKRSGFAFQAWGAGNPALGIAPVCRFWGGASAGGAPTHFYTIDAAECTAYRSNPKWTYEGVAFYAKQPVDGRCSGSDAPVYRLYNNRPGYPNYRFTADAAAAGNTAGRGWVQQGTAFCAAAAKPGQLMDYLLFSLNIQDFSYPELSIATVQRALDLHERHQVPVGMYFTETMIDVFERDAPSLWARLKTSPWVSLGYHIRPPKPYHHLMNWSNLASQPADTVYNTVLNYETHGLDLVTGQPTSDAGGLQKLVASAGGRPVIAAAQTNSAVIDPVAKVFRDLGTSFWIDHGATLNLGDTRAGFYVRPEHYDLKLFEHTTENAGNLIEQAFATAHATAGARAPFVVGVKMHDNDFFAEDSAWLTVYVNNGTRRPPWNTTVKSPLKSAADQAAQWTVYEAAVSYAAANRQRYGSWSTDDFAAVLANASPAPKVYVSGTMHIESAFNSWPNIDNLIAFFRRAVNAGKVGTQTTGMRWSIGPDRGWLESEPRAAEAVRTLAGLGVQFDIHSHSAADRARCAQLLTQYGAPPTTVISGALVSEWDQLIQPSVDTSGFRWQGTMVWGFTTGAGHADGTDDLSYGLSRPRSGTLWHEHDPNGPLIRGGPGPHDLARVESLVSQVKPGAGYAPVMSAGIMVSPKTLTVVGAVVGTDTPSSDGIDAIEAWAARIGKLDQVKWATISETGAAWQREGEVPSRIYASESTR